MEKRGVCASVNAVCEGGGFDGDLTFWIIMLNGSFLRGFVFGIL